VTQPQGAVLAAIAAALSARSAEVDRARKVVPAWTIAMRSPELSIDEIAALRHGMRDGRCSPRY
jgi:hypothetical protein